MRRLVAVHGLPPFGPPGPGFFFCPPPTMHTSNPAYWTQTTVASCGRNPAEKKRARPVKIPLYPSKGVQIQPVCPLLTNLTLRLTLRPKTMQGFPLKRTPQEENFRTFTGTDWNAFPTGTSHAITGLDASTNYKVRVMERREAETGITVHPRYFVSSLDAAAEQLLATVRAHWTIENSFHWSMDVTFREDQSRVREDHGPQNMATSLNVFHNLVKREPSLKAGIPGNRLRAGWREDYLLKALRGKHD